MTEIIYVDLNSIPCIIGYSFTRFPYHCTFFTARGVVEVVSGDPDQVLVLRQHGGLVAPVRHSQKRLHVGDQHPQQRILF